MTDSLPTPVELADALQVLIEKSEEAFDQAAGGVSGHIEDAIEGLAGGASVAEILERFPTSDELHEDRWAVENSYRGAGRVVGVTRHDLLDCVKTAHRRRN